MKKLIILFLSITICTLIYASPADPTPHKVIQPNGDTIYVSLHGDEYASWYEDNRGDIIAMNNDKYWVYVTIENGEKILTNQIVSQTSIPQNINRDSVSEFIIRKRTETYTKMNDDTSKTTRAITGKYAPLPTSGTQKILTILVQFTDVKFQNQTGIKNLVTNMMNQQNFRHPGQSNVTGSLRDFYLQASYNQLDVRTTVIGPYTVSHNKAYYGAKTSENNDTLPQKLAREVMEMIIDDIDVSQFDNNNDGWVECIHILCAGQGQEIASYGSKDDIWSHQWYLDDNDDVSGDGVKMSRYIMTPEKYGNHYHGIGTVCHELGHILGAPDFYDTNYYDNGKFPGTGKWDLMAGGNFNRHIFLIGATNPAHPNPYIKTKIFGWTNAIELSGNNKLYTMPPSELYGAIYKLSTSTQGEYYLLENRQGGGLLGSGLVVYHVHANIDNFIPNNKVNITHPQNLYVVAANNHIAKPTDSIDSYGNIDSSTATFKDTCTNNIFFTSQTTPSNCAWNGTSTQNKDVCFIREEIVGGIKCIKFVLNPEIEGPDVLCDSAVYSLQHVPTGATIEWDFERYTGSEAYNKIPFIIGSGQGTANVIFKRGIQRSGGTSEPDPEIPAPPMPYPMVTNSINSNILFAPYQGTRRIYAHVTFNGNRYTLEKEIYMPEDLVIDDMGYGEGNPLRPNTPYLFSLKYPVESNWESNVEWTISDINGTYTRYGNSTVVNTGNSIAISLIAKHLVDCNNTKSDTLFLQVIPNGGVIFQNPASGNVEISVIGSSADNEINNTQTLSINQSEAYMGAYRLELWHDIYGKVREMDVPENTPTVTMNVDGLNSGIYILRLIINNQLIQTSQMIIK